MAIESAIELAFDAEKVLSWLKAIEQRRKAIEKRESAFCNSIGIFVFQDVLDHFKNEQGSDGKWVGWSSSYSAKMKAAGKGGNNILQDTGRLRNSFTPGQWRKTSQGIEWYNPAKTNSGFPYAYAHDEGGPKLPKRDFMWLSDAAMNKISEATLAFLAGD
jgi:phage gpG-like protein